MERCYTKKNCGESRLIFEFRLPGETKAEGTERKSLKIERLKKLKKILFRS